MFYLDKKQFLPAFILFSIIFLPITIIIACVGLIDVLRFFRGSGSTARAPPSSG